MQHVVLNGAGPERLRMHAATLSLWSLVLLMHVQDPVEDTKGNNGDQGEFVITNLRLLWISKKSKRTNISVGYNCVTAVNVKTANSRLKGGAGLEPSRALCFCCMWKTLGLTAAPQSIAHVVLHVDLVIFAGEAQAIYILTSGYGGPWGRLQELGTSFDAIHYFFTMHIYASLYWARLQSSTVNASSSSSPTSSRARIGFSMWYSPCSKPTTTAGSTGSSSCEVGHACACMQLPGPACPRGFSAPCNTTFCSGPLYLQEPSLQTESSSSFRRSRPTAGSMACGTSAASRWGRRPQQWQLGWQSGGLVQMPGTFQLRELHCSENKHEQPGLSCMLQRQQSLSLRLSTGSEAWAEHRPPLQHAPTMLNSQPLQPSTSIMVTSTGQPGDLLHLQRARGVVREPGGKLQRVHPLPAGKFSVRLS